MRINTDWLPNFVKRRIINSEIKKLQFMALQVKDNKQFRQIILSVKPGFRRAVYDQLSPMLKFKPKPFLLINK